MRDGFQRKIVGFGVSVLLILLIFSVLVSASGVKLSTGVLGDSKVFVGDSLVFNDVSLMIRKAEVISVEYLVFAIYYQSNDEKVASVDFSLIGEEIIGSDSAGVFTVDNVTDTSNLPYRSRGCYGYGYGYGSMDLTVIYTISYLAQAPGKFYAKLFVYSSTQVYDSGKSKPFRVFPAPSSPISIAVDIKPGHWPNLLSLQHSWLLSIALCGSDSLDVHMIDLKSIRLSFDCGKKVVKPLFWRYRDVATVGDQTVGGDGFLDLKLWFITPQVIHVLRLLKHPGETCTLTITGLLKREYNSVSFHGEDVVVVDLGCKHKK